MNLFSVLVAVFDVSFFFFKQKTAYEMRISDWSSDVCSSDLHDLPRLHHAAKTGDLGHIGDGLELVAQEPVLQRAQLAEVVLASMIDQRVQIGRAACRERVCQYV